MAANKKKNRMPVEKRGDAKNSIFRFMIAAILLLVQILLLIFIVQNLEARYPLIAAGISGAAVIAGIAVYCRRMNSAFKIGWIILISAFPLAGVCLYILMGRSHLNDKVRDRAAAIERKMQGLLVQDEKVLEAVEAEDRAAANQFRYITGQTKLPVVGNTDVMYYPDAAEELKAMLGALQMARKFIFMEYHAVENAESFAKIKQILASKAREGVEVRILYDDVGSGSFISSGFIREMESLGIRCRDFNPVMPVLNIFMNNRDHRKLTVIDGRVGFTGGFNLANEYFHVTEPYGFWKDTGIGLAGEGVRHLSLLFLQMWNLIGETDSAMDYEKYVPEFAYESRETGWLLPYGTGPLSEDRVAEEVYLNMIRSAERYIWFVTPYLILTDEMTRELTGAAKRGVDVRIVTPGIPDKKLVFRETCSYFPQLIRGGVRIYEYTPGFCHAKMCVSDDTMAAVGTINLDYRSLYHHFENGVLLYRCQVIPRICADFRRMFKSSREIPQAETENRSFFKRAGQAFLRLIAPLL